ncbi:hypothetical protein SAMD00019534_048370 [Acytostelium subglobosum LB1]|uniref:hypothetical protein n=1 Tax=Acytostelium subglobosum LB1 TaxID=1410327 RepID=UPI000644ED8A|nr:hypothetical protein SAMD00019534_048370 [Acytostelium subglobosum LB1]GAM21662.1 hypothetical protein SAMD00019534_048370 [Acytostelium subglobosum LB1]|eukprot:XP_012755781.1 hypothetical protein SAMD00019534_048370 [Acytostelium subglobosum LB1]
MSGMNNMNMGGMGGMNNMGGQGGMGQGGMGGGMEEEGFKVFVGHIPLNMTEQEIGEIFEKYGEILDISIIKDKRSNISKGCAFITFATKDVADVAMNTTNSSMTFLGDLHKPLQVKYSDNEIEKMERKLFIGMLGNADEEAITGTFGQFGAIEELTIVREKDGKPKGYGFIKFQSREEAEECIRQLDGKATLPGSLNPVIVRFAETERQKRKKQQQQMMTNNNQWGGGGGGNGFYQPQQQKPFPMFGGYNNQMGGMQQPKQHQQQQQQQDNGFGNPHSNPFNNSGRSGAFPMMKPRYPRQQQYNDDQGPESNDLFIYYLPPSYGDNELRELFQSFGEVISAKVYIDKVTQQSKCFGFVSYNNTQSAINAINNMNGFQIEGKKLKVNFKKERN